VLVWDRGAAIGGAGRPSAEAAAFAGTLGVRIKLTPPRDPESKGLVERRNGYFETSFLPGRTFCSPFDFNAQIQAWLTGTANARHLRSIGTSPAARWATDRAGMVELPPVAPMVGSTGRIRLSRDYYVRIDGNDYSVNPRVIGRFVNWITTLALVAVTCDEQIVATHDRVWGSGVTVTDPEHRATAKRCAPSSPPPVIGPPPALTPTGTSWPCAPCLTTTRFTAWSSTPLPPTRPPQPGRPPQKGSR